jgi:hypothetical protein
MAKKKRQKTIRVKKGGRDPSLVSSSGLDQFFIKNDSLNDSTQKTSYSKIIGGVVAAGVIATGIWALVKFKK